MGLLDGDLDRGLCPEGDLERAGDRERESRGCPLEVVVGEVGSGAVGVVVKAVEEEGSPAVGVVEGFDFDFFFFFLGGSVVEPLSLSFSRPGAGTA